MLNTRQPELLTPEQIFKRKVIDVIMKGESLSLISRYDGVWELIEEVRQAEREAPAKISEQWKGRRLEGEYPDTAENQAWDRGVDMAAYAIAAAIRARSTK
ncbi:MAG: hypothetical protein Q8Q65_03300 [bacterium]|nr:hypothetical protein [bacterium]